MANLLKLVGVPAAEADGRAKAVLTIETTLANASISRAARRNPKLTHYNTRAESFKSSVRTDPHSPDQFRVIGVMQNVPEFATAFGCSAGQPMVSASACRVW